jgi:hypothetical protein
METKRNISPGQVAVSVVIFGVLLVVAFMEAQTRQNVLFHQVLNTVRVTMVLFGVATCLYVLPGDSQQKFSYWLLFWSLSFLSYLIHVYFSFVLYFHGSFSDFYTAQGAFVATTNLFISAWWLCDFILAWFGDSSLPWIRVQRTGIHLLILFTFFLSTVIFHAVDNKETFVVVLGVLQALSVLIAFIIRLRAKKVTVSAASS